MTRLKQFFDRMIVAKQYFDKIFIAAAFAEVGEHGMALDYLHDGKRKKKRIVKRKIKAERPRLRL